MVQMQVEREGKQQQHCEKQECVGISPISPN